MRGIATLLAVGLLRWLVHRILLTLDRRLPYGPADSAKLSKRFKKVNRAIGNVIIAAAIVLFPLLHGQNPRLYYESFLPLDHRALDGLRGFAVALMYLSLLYMAWLVTDNLRFRVRDKPSRLARRLAVVPLSTALGALVEELLFRGILLADLLKGLAPTTAVLSGALFFAAAHYTRRVKRYWTLAGHVALGILLCTTFAWTGSLWLPMGLHAGGIFMTLGTRPFVRSTGPGWLVGASIFPYAGLVGVAALILLTFSMWLSYGGVR